MEIPMMAWPNHLDLLKSTKRGVAKAYKAALRICVMASLVLNLPPQSLAQSKPIKACKKFCHQFWSTHQIEERLYSNCLKRIHEDEIARTSPHPTTIATILLLDSIQGETVDISATSIKWLPAAQEGSALAWYQAASILGENGSLHLGNAMFDFLSTQHPASSDDLEAELEAMRELAWYNIDTDSLAALRKARTIREHICQVHRTRGDTTSGWFAADLFNLGVIQTSTYDFANARTTLEAVLNLETQLLDRHPEIESIHWDRILTHEFLSQLYAFMGMERDALFSINNALEANQSGHFDYDASAQATLLNSKASILTQFGRHFEALEARHQELEITREEYGAESESYAISLWALGSIYFNLGDLESAEQFTMKAASLDSIVTPKHSVSWGLMLENLAAFEEDRGEHQAALDHYKEALRIYDKELGLNNPTTASTQLSMATCLLNLKEPIQAHEMAVLGLNALREIMPDNDPTIAQAWESMGRIYTALQLPTEAESALGSALEIYNTTLGEESYWAVNCLIDLAHLQSSQGNWAALDSILGFAFNTAIRQAEKQERNLATELNGGIYEQLHSIVNLEYRCALKSESTLDYTLLLNSRGREWRPRQDGRDTTEAMLLKRQELRVAQQTLAALQDPFNRNRNADNELQLRSEIESLMAEFQSEFTADHLSPANLQNVLNEGETFLDIFLVEEGHRDSSQYIAFICSSNTPVSYITIGNRHTVESLLRIHNNLTQDPQIQAPRLLWEVDSTLLAPIASFLTETKRLIVTPDGAFAELGWSTVQGSLNRTFIGMGMDITLCTSAMSLIGNRQNPAVHNDFNESDAIVMCNPQYNLKESEEPIQYTAQTREISMLRTTAENQSWSSIPPLFATEKEGQRISDQLSTSGYTTLVLNAADATEEAMKNIQGPTILHLATHGYFLPDSVDAPWSHLHGSSSESMDMYRSGLLFSGAENTLRDGQKRNRENGWFSALEASALNLESTELVVLSACETGKGVLRKGRGVYGLQRGFHQAGAKNVIMSLWQVDDEVTSELMTAFYRSWLVSKDAPSALREAQNEIRQHHPHPYYWGAWISSANQ
jgi:CHAT domain-containing protein/tetratricopeptide (TPR) repeat protein